MSYQALQAKYIKEITVKQICLSHISVTIISQSLIVTIMLVVYDKWQTIGRIEHSAKASKHTDSE